MPCEEEEEEEEEDEGAGLVAAAPDAGSVGRQLADLAAATDVGGRGWSISNMGCIIGFAMSQSTRFS
jgi:hypothetical protein